MRLKQFALFIAMIACEAAVQASPFVDQFLADVLAKHPAVKAAQAELRAADKEVTGAWLQILPEPQVTTSSPTTRKYSPTDAAVSQPKNTVAIEQKLWAGGKFTAGINSAEAANKAAQQKYEEARINTAVSVVEALQAYQSARRRVQVLDSMLSRLQRFVDLMDRRVAAEVSAPVDAALVRSRLVQANVDKANAIASLYLSITRLEQLNLTGESIDWGGLDLVVLGESVATGLPKGRDDAMNELQRVANVSPTVLRYQFEAEVATSRQEIIAADRFPQVYARIQKDRYSSDSYWAASHPNDLAPTVAYVGLRYAPGAGFATSMQSAAASERAQSAREQLDAAHREVTNQLHQDWEEWSSAGSRVVDYKTALMNAEVVSASYERQFIVGRLSWQQTLDAVRELGQMGVALADAQSSYWGASYKLRLRQGFFAEVMQEAQ